MVFRSGRLKLRALALVGIILLTLLTVHNIESLSRYSKTHYYSIRAGWHDYVKFADTVDSPFSSEDLQQRHVYWANLFRIFSENQLNFTDYDSGDIIRYIDKSQQKGGPNSKTTLLSKAFVSEDVIEELKSKHDSFIRLFPYSSFSKTYLKNTKGIVMVGGGRFSWLSYLSIRNLRITGLDLPVEVMLPKFEDFEKEIHFCTIVLPKVNARCMIMPQILGLSVMRDWSSKLSSYQLKSLALMTSLFQHVLLLDSDNVLISNPDSVFNSELYKENGMITWPDYWERTISPFYYTISGIKLQEKRRARYNRMPLLLEDDVLVNEDDKESIPYHDLEGAVPNLSTESGQMFIDKRLHSKTLLLSLYYNVFGPDIYYKLFSLGEQGEGDKDTFVSAAIAMKEPFYQVKSFIKTLGYFDSNNKFQGVAMGQKNPLLDFSLYEKRFPLKRTSLDGVAGQIEEIEKIIKSDFDSHNDIPILFMHCNYPKWDPIDLMDREDIRDTENKKLKYRLYNGFKYEKHTEINGMKSISELDFEYEQWSLIQQILCTEGISFVHFQDKDISEVCKFATNQVTWLGNNS